MFPLNEIISDFHRQTLEQLEVNLVTQRVWPTEVYPHYGEINEIRRMTGGWFSTGAGARSFRGSIVNADEAGNVTLEYSFNDYMRYVDIGVGGRTSANEVDRSKNVRYKSRYISSWDRSKGRSSRPGIMPEFRHLQTRILNYLVDFYGHKGEVEILNTFEGLNFSILGESIGGGIIF